MDNNISKNPQTGGDVEYIKIENTTFKVTSFYTGKTSLYNLIKTGIKRDADSVLRQINNS